MSAIQLLGPGGAIKSFIETTLKGILASKTGVGVGLTGVLPLEVSGQ